MPSLWVLPEDSFKVISTRVTIEVKTTQQWALADIDPETWTRGDGLAVFRHAAYGDPIPAPWRVAVRSRVWVTDDDWAYPSTSAPSNPDTTDLDGLKAFLDAHIELDHPAIRIVRSFDPNPEVTDTEGVYLFEGASSGLESTVNIQWSLHLKGMCQCDTSSTLTTHSTSMQP